MSTEARELNVGGLRVEVLRKDIKHLHLGVYPPSGRVRVSAPLRTKEDAIRLAVVTRLPWIRKRQRALREQPRQSARDFVTGETHYYRGRAYRLIVVEADGPPSVRLRPNRRLELRVRPGASRRQREAALTRWYRERLREQLEPLVQKLQEKVGVEADEWRIKRMRTRWGACTQQARRIWINLELAKKPPRCLEFIVAHEIVHLIERRHNERFLALMSEAMPDWQSRRTALNQSPLAHELWTY